MEKEKGGRTSSLESDSSHGNMGENAGEGGADGGRLPGEKQARRGVAFWKRWFRLFRPKSPQPIRIGPCLPGDLVEFWALHAPSGHSFRVAEPGFVDLPANTYAAWVNGRRVVDQGRAQ